MIVSPFRPVAAGAGCRRTRVGLRGFVGALMMCFAVSFASMAAPMTQSGPAGGGAVGPLPDRDRANSAPFRPGKAECEAAGMDWLPLSKACADKPDPIFPWHDGSGKVAPASAAAIRRAGGRNLVRCDGDGVTGYRIQVLYVRASDVPSSFVRYRDSFQLWAADADEIFARSAAETGGSRNIRFVTDGACNPVVTEVMLPPAGDDSFDAMSAELKAQGYNRSDRKYLVFMDTVMDGVCGLGNRYDDERPGQENWNNIGPDFAADYADCWSGTTAAHEIMHTLGGVQLGAPNSSGGGHCVDEWDNMCYSDRPNYPAMRTDCSEHGREARFDCNHNDYFHTNPPPGSYLATHWNIANNRFLIAGGAALPPPPVDSASPAVSWIAPTGNGGTYQAPGRIVSLEVSATDDARVNRVVFGRWDESDNWIVLGRDYTGPTYSVQLDVSDLFVGNNPICAIAYDTSDNRQTPCTHIWVNRGTGTDLTGPLVSITSPSDGAKVKSPFTLNVAANDGGTGIAEVGLYSCGTTTCTKFAADNTAPYAFSVTASPGWYTFQVTAIDNAGNVTDSSPIDVTVQKKKKKKKKKKHKKKSSSVSLERATVSATPVGDDPTHRRGAGTAAEPERPSALAQRRPLGETDT